MQNKKILISGAGIAGLTLAYFLHKKGFTPTIIEKADKLRNGGYMIDFFSSGITVAKEMGIIEELKKKDHRFTTIKQYTHKNKKNFAININGFREKMNEEFFNFSRTELVEVLYQKIKDNVAIRFSTSIKSIKENTSSLEIVFDNGDKKDFDLLIAADGIHSNVRALTYAQNEVNKYFLNYYVAGLTHNIPIPLKSSEISSMLTPKRQMMSYPSSKKLNSSLFIFHSKKLSYENKEKKIEILKEIFEDFSSPVSEIIAKIEKEENFFFDEVSQIKIKGARHKGRVVLLGDAAYCLTLLSGQGASMAMTGAYVLAEKLTQHEGNYTKVYKDYESNLRPHIEKMQKKAVKNTASFLPISALSLWFRNLIMPFVFTKLFTPFIIRHLGAENYFKKNHS